MGDCLTDTSKELRTPDATGEEKMPEASQELKTPEASDSAGKEKMPEVSQQESMPDVDLKMAEASQDQRCQTLLRRKICPKLFSTRTSFQKMLMWRSLQDW